LEVFSDSGIVDRRGFAVRLTLIVFDQREKKPAKEIGRVEVPLMELLSRVGESLPLDDYSQKKSPGYIKFVKLRSVGGRALPIMSGRFNSEFRDRRRFQSVKQANQ
jgi:hypothetical protein